MLMDWLQSALLNVVRGLFAGHPDDSRVRAKALGAAAAALEATNARLAQLIAASAQ